MPKLAGSKNNGYTIAIAVLVVLLSAATVAAGALIRGRSYIVVSMLLALYSTVPFFASFERRKPQARELVVLAVMCALAVAARAAFIWAPNFKPIVGIVIITAIAFGPSSGFMCGALSAVVSNFIFGQGPWTPFQMVCFGLAGFAFGILAQKGVIPKGRLSLKARILLSISGFLYILLLGGPILDLSTVLYILSDITPESILATLVAGIPINVIHGSATFLTLLLLSNPILDKLERLRIKYGMME